MKNKFTISYEKTDKNGNKTDYYSHEIESYENESYSYSIEKTFNPYDIDSHKEKSKKSSKVKIEIYKNSNNRNLNKAFSNLSFVPSDLNINSEFINDLINYPKSDDLPFSSFFDKNIAFFLLNHHKKLTTHQIDHIIKNVDLSYFHEDKSLLNFIIKKHRDLKLNKAQINEIINRVDLNHFQDNTSLASILLENADYLNMTEEQVFNIFSKTLPDKKNDHFMFERKIFNQLYSSFFEKNNVASYIFSEKEKQFLTSNFDDSSKSFNYLMIKPFLLAGSIFTDYALNHLYKKINREHISESKNFLRESVFAIFNTYKLNLSQSIKLFDILNKEIIEISKKTHHKDIYSTLKSELMLFSSTHKFFSSISTHDHEFNNLGKLYKDNSFFHSNLDILNILIDKNEFEVKLFSFEFENIHIDSINCLKLTKDNYKEKIKALTQEKSKFYNIFDFKNPKKTLQQNLYNTCQRREDISLNTSQYANKIPLKHTNSFLYLKKTVDFLFGFSDEFNYNELISLKKDYETIIFNIIRNPNELSTLNEIDLFNNKLLKSFDNLSNENSLKIKNLIYIEEISIDLSKIVLDKLELNTNQVKKHHDPFDFDIKKYRYIKDKNPELYSFLENLSENLNEFNRTNYFGLHNYQVALFKKQIDNNLSKSLDFYHKEIFISNGLDKDINPLILENINILKDKISRNLLAIQQSISHKPTIQYRTSASQSIHPNTKGIYE